jgi:uncharacterized iron-regulated membrane protein
MRKFHRILALFITLFAVYLGMTGSLIQAVDLRTLLTHASAADPNMKAIREGIDGTGDFQVIDTADYTGATLPVGLDFDAAFNGVAASAQAALAQEPMQFVELRMVDGVPVGQVKSGKRLLRFDALTGAPVGESVPHQPAGGTFGVSTRNTFKALHRMTAFSDWTLGVNVLVGVSLCVMLVTGFVMYFSLLAARRRTGRRNPFWSAGGSWRSLHRAVSLISAAFLLVVAVSGSWLAIESLGRAVMVAREPELRARGVALEDPGAPLRDSDLPPMLSTTMAAYRRAYGSQPVRVVRLRIYGGMPQGIVVTGELEAHQVVFNARSGKRASETEPGYPYQHFPFGWQAHQLAKRIHRGDIIGLTGRWMDLIAGLSLIYLSVSGAVMYVELWQRRRRSGRGAFLWK